MRTVSGAARIFTRCNKKIRTTKNNASTINNNSGSSSSATPTAGVGRTPTSSAQQPSFRFKSTSSTPSASSANAKSTRYCRPIGCHVSSYLGNNTTTSLLSLMEPSKVTLDECEFDEDDIDGT